MNPVFFLLRGAAIVWGRVPDIWGLRTSGFSRAVLAIFISEDRWLGATLERGARELAKPPIGAPFIGDPLSHGQISRGTACLGDSLRVLSLGSRKSSPRASVKDGCGIPSLITPAPNRGRDRRGGRKSVEPVRPTRGESGLAGAGTWCMYTEIKSWYGVSRPVEIREFSAALHHDHLTILVSH